MSMVAKVEPLRQTPAETLPAAREAARNPLVVAWFLVALRSDGMVEYDANGEENMVAILAELAARAYARGDE